MELTEAVRDQKVLDHGYVRYIASMGGDEDIISAARMSVGRGFISWEPYTRCAAGCDVWHLGKGRPPSALGLCEHLEKDRDATVYMPRGDLGLLEYLYSNGHTSPFEMCQLHVEINAPILVWRQFHRHRVFSYNEFSARYGELPDEFYVPTEERLRESFLASANKQASSKGGGERVGRMDALRSGIAAEQHEAHLLYKMRLDMGMAPELARLNVPVSQYSKCRVNGDLHNILHSLLAKRLHEHAQYEIRVFAQALLRIVKALWPRSEGVFQEYTLGAVRFSATEMECLKGLIDVMRAASPDHWQAELKHMPFSPLGSAAKKTAFLKKLGIEG